MTTPLICVQLFSAYTNMFIIQIIGVVVVQHPTGIIKYKILF